MVRLVLVILCFSVSVFADEVAEKPLPKIELGVGLGLAYLPSYPGSDEPIGLGFPLPYVIYRGQILKADREGGYRAVLLEKGSVEFDLGFGGGFATDSEDNEARDGMDELDYTIEVGPRAKWTIVRNKEHQLRLLVPVRYAMSVDFEHQQYRGWVFNPSLNWKWNLPYGEGWQLFTGLGASWATKRFMEYFYTVEADEATAQRPAYEAESGFWAVNTSLIVGKRMPKIGLSIFTGVSLNNYDPGPNTDSPLLRDRYTASYVSGLAKKLWESDEMGASN